MAELRFQKGDLVRIDPDRCKTWINAGYTEGIIYGLAWAEGGSGYGRNHENPGPDWKIRLVGYNYGANETNTHTVSDDAISFAVSEEEINDTIASIVNSLKET